MTTTATTPQQHLALVINHWGDLHDALPAGGTGTAFGIGLTAYLDYLDQADADEVAEMREARGWKRDGTTPLGERPVPIRLRVHDTMRGVERALLHCADQTASSVQRPPMAPPAQRHASVARTRAERLDWEDHLRRVDAAKADRRDPRRWSYTDPRARTAVLAAVWLTHRLEDAPGPFRPLHIQQTDRIRTVAAGAAQRVLAALDMARRTQTAPQPCPHCRGTLRVEGGDGQPPAVRCRDCGWARTAELEGAA